MIIIYTTCIYNVCDLLYISMSKQIIFDKVVKPHVLYQKVVVECRCTFVQTNTEQITQINMFLYYKRKLLIQCITHNTSFQNKPFKCLSSQHLNHVIIFYSLTHLFLQQSVATTTTMGVMRITSARMVPVTDIATSIVQVCVCSICGPMKINNKTNSHLNLTALTFYTQLICIYKALYYIQANNKSYSMHAWYILKIVKTAHTCSNSLCILSISVKLLSLNTLPYIYTSYENNIIMVNNVDLLIFSP